MRLLFLVFLLISTPAVAGVGENLCGRVFPDSKPVEKRTGGFAAIGFLIKALFAPASLVQIEKIENHSGSDEKPEELKLAFIGPNEVKLTPAESEKYREYRKALKSIKSDFLALGLSDSLEDLKNYEECLVYVSSTPEIEAKLQDLETLISENLSLSAKLDEQNTSDEIKAKERFMRRKNWEIIRGKNVNEIYSMIKSRRPSAVLLLNHATADGKLFDSYLNAFPATFFQSLKGHVDNLIIYSCYSNEVILNYQLNRIAKEINTFFPKVRNSVKDLLGEKTPVVALRSIRKARFGSNPRYVAWEKCHLELDKKLPRNFALFLNRIYLGAGEESYWFDCGFLDTENKIEIYSTAGTDLKDEMGVGEILFNANTLIPLKAFHSKTTNRHIVTKGSFNYKR